MTTLLITGSRAATPAMLEYAVRAVERAHELGWIVVVGDADGVDQQVLYKSCWLGIPFAYFGITPYPRHYCCNTHLNAYEQIEGNYPARDRRMVGLADRVLAIWNGTSNGTRYTFQYAQKLGKQVDVRTFALRAERSVTP